MTLQNRFKFADFNRFAQVVVKTFAQINFTHTGNRACSEHDNRRCIAQDFFAPHELKSLDTAQAGHHVIEEDDMIKILLRKFNALLTAFGEVGENFIALEQAADNFQIHVVIVDGKNFRAFRR